MADLRSIKVGKILVMPNAAADRIILQGIGVSLDLPNARALASAIAEMADYVEEVQQELASLDERDRWMVDNILREDQIAALLAHRIEEKKGLGIVRDK